MAWFAALKVFSLEKFHPVWFAALNFFFYEKSHPATLGILSNEAAKAMAHLLHLYRSLSEEEFFKFLKGPLKSRGVALLSSTDEVSLLSLFCSEKIAELDYAVAIISYLARKCSDPNLKRFDAIYAEIKRGNFTLRKLQYNSKNAQKMIERMDKYVVATCNLQCSQESLREIGIWEKKLYQCNKLNCLTLHRYYSRANNLNDELFHEKITNLKKQVHRWRDASLWNHTFDKIVGLMLPVVSLIYAQICVLFGPFAPALCSKKLTSSSTTPHHKLLGIRIQPEPDADYCLLADKNKYINANTNRRKARSCPILKTSERKITLFYSSELCVELGHNIQGCEKTTSNDYRKGLLRLAPASTVGGAGLATPYANAIVLAQGFLHSPLRISNEGRGHIYGMLTDRVRWIIKEKMKRRSWYRDAMESDGHAMAEGCREAVETTLKWLGPMAQDTLKWQNERYLEQQRLDAKPTVSLLQTLYFADLEKTEAAIVEILVGLSCIFTYEKRHLGGARLL
ncbi:uncharacterized protein LOC110806320 [Carica papaya]|uniref:uncharacterized protein LOC110806320 n=1 Tax=Carica papaya TaxID=3649 RepID=UPI000B8CA5F8|nr:uncharacterized protein LOC110806320 [Carica papaya]